jgi:hypothetical protein
MADNTHEGTVSDSQTGFKLQDSSVKAPDVALTLQARLTGLAQADVSSFGVLVVTYMS